MCLVYGTWEWSKGDRCNAYYALAAWMAFSKFVKLITHFIRFPIDVFLWPVSVLFGWYHGIIKWHAMCTLNEVSGSHLHRSSPPLTGNRRPGDPALELTHPIRREWLSRTKSITDTSTIATKKHSSRKCLLLTTLRTHRLSQPELPPAWHSGSASIGII